MDSSFFLNEFYRCRGNTLTMCEFHESTCNGFGDIWWTDNPIYFSSIDVSSSVQNIFCTAAFCMKGHAAWSLFSYMHSNRAMRDNCLP